MENIFEEFMAKGFPYLLKKTNLQIGEAQQTSSRIYANKTASRHIGVFKNRP